MEEERLLILQMLSEKKITAAEAAELLRALEGPPAPPVTEAPREVPPGPDFGDAPAPSASGAAAISGGQGNGFSDWLGGMLSRLSDLISLGTGLEVIEEVEGSLSANHVPVDLNVGNGRLCVYAWDRPHFKAIITRRVRAGSEAEARSRGAELAPFVVTDAGIRFVTRHYGELQMAGLDLYLPGHLTYTLGARTGNGRIELEGLTGSAAALRSGNGRIRVEGGAWGRVEARTGNGSIKVGTDAAEVDVNTGNGSAEVTLLGNRSARAEATSGNGSITFDTASVPQVGLQVDLATGVGGIHDQSCRQWESQRLQDHLTTKKMSGQTIGYTSAANKVVLRARTGVGSITLL